ncbi:TPA: DUF4238 domain-containing protein [Legionella pneumophila]|nr:DUF4238 domain-containing protein [Legionella jordanis]HBP6900942.1 DUF4238 domain-containing protein [Legionella pneumophila]HCC3234160.1 DUF4238 domain-containing protein [Legionella pneumophila subsp. pneumophila]HDO7799166.1 DUF4238 domain-containing protein [Legionella pneumophila]HDO7969308.1 DUF4238 domain-containing protein [Legionella pneumophila]
MQSNSKSAFLKLYPDYKLDDIERITSVWDEVIDQIIRLIMEYSSAECPTIHIDLREETVHELAKIISWISEVIVKERTQETNIKTLNYDKENKECLLDNLAKKKIKKTARDIFEKIWLKKYKERWEPKSLYKLQKEQSPKQNTLATKKVYDNHFISKSFIKRHWSFNNEIFIYKRDKSNFIALPKKKFSQWGFLKNFYTDRLEAYYQLIEGDAYEPLKMLIEGQLLNMPQKLALIGFIIIQHIRNPSFLNQLNNHMKPIIEKHVGKASAEDPEYYKKLNEYLYADNAVYEKMARPFITNQWVILKTENPTFILPDTFCYFGNYKDAPFKVIPLSNVTCLIILPWLADKSRKGIPIYMNKDQHLAELIVKILILTTNKEFLGYQGFVLPSEDDPTQLSVALGDFFASIQNKIDKSP